MALSDTPTVFIADDNARMRGAMRRLLKTVGCIPTFASPQEFLRLKLLILRVASCLMCAFLE
jgi:FixJ family two-component response regulator